MPLWKNVPGKDLKYLANQLPRNTDIECKKFVRHSLNLFFIAEDIYVPALTVGQFLKSTASFYPKFSITDFYAYLKTLDVDPEQLMSSMSYGQQKKAMIAFGLATNASVLIMDEPTNGLD